MKSSLHTVSELRFILLLVLATSKVVIAAIIPLVLIFFTLVSAVCLTPFQYPTIASDCNTCAGSFCYE